MYTNMLTVIPVASSQSRSYRAIESLLTKTRATGECTAVQRGLCWISRCAWDWTPDIC